MSAGVLDVLCFMDLVVLLAEKQCNHVSLLGKFPSFKSWIPSRLSLLLFTLYAFK